VDSDKSVDWRQIVDPEGEFIAGETIIKLYYWKRLMAT
jgi:hypothetical protein